MDYENILLTLEKYGLSHNEAKIYLTLLRTGNAMAGKIAKEAMMDRTSCYDSLKKLQKRGLITYVVEANRKSFKATDPDRLIGLLKEKEDEVDKILPQLKGLYSQDIVDSNVTMYKGYKGLKTVFEDIAAKAKENLVIDSSNSFKERMPYYLPHFVKAIEKSKIHIKHLVRRGQAINPSKTTEVRFFPMKLKKTPITTNIYADKIAFILWTDIPEAIIIKNKDAAESYKEYFEILWKNGKK